MFYFSYLKYKRKLLLFQILYQIYLFVRVSRNCDLCPMTNANSVMKMF